MAGTGGRGERVRLGLAVGFVLVGLAATGHLSPGSGGWHLPHGKDPGPTFQACTRTPADPATTNLRPVARIDDANDTDVDAGSIPHGPVVLEHAADLQLDDGRIGAGSGYDAATGQVSDRVVVAPGAVTASVTLAVLDSPTAGRRVAFVEVRVGSQAPVSWEADERLSIGTDGGDGGFARGTMRPSDDLAVDDYVGAFFPDGDDDSGTVCVLASSADGVDAVLFSTGYGDGGYPTFVGRAADGSVVSLVSFGYVLPWRDSGLPGTPPSFGDD